MAIVKEEGRERAMPASQKKKRTRLFMLRHGQVEKHHELRFNGFNDVGLTDEGFNQLERAARYLAQEHIDEIYCSDLARARIGAEAIAADRGITPVPLEELREMNMGVFDGKTFLEISREYGDVFSQWREDLLNFRLPGGESFADMGKRVASAMLKIMEGKEGKTIAVVAHGGVNRLILVRALNMDPSQAFRIEQDYGCLNVIDYYPEWTIVKLVNRSF